MTPAQRKRIFDALLGNMEPLKRSDEPQIRKMLDDFEECVQRDVESVEPIIDELVNEAILSCTRLPLTDPQSPKEVQLGCSVIPDGTDLLIRFQLGDGIERELHVSRVHAVQFAQHLMNKAAE